MRVLTVLAILAAAGISAVAVPLVEAAQHQDDAAVARLLAEGADVNAAEPDGTRALHWAAHHGNERMVAQLLQAGADPNVRNEFGSTPMSEAALAMDRAAIELLLDAGADVESPNPDGQTTLMVVARNSDVALARLLLDRGADVNAVEQYRKQTALMWAAANSQGPMVGELVARGADVNARAEVNHWERQVTAEPRAIHRPSGGLTALLYASREGCLECVKHLAEGGADLDLADPDNVTPLIVAITNAHFDVARYLIEAGANPHKWDWWGRTPLYQAVDYNTLPHGGRPDHLSLDQTTPLEIIEMLLEAGVNPNPRLKLLPPYRATGPDRGVDRMLNMGTTPLLRAAKAFDAPAIQLLLEHGALVDLGNDQGDLPITAAGGAGSVDADTRGWYITSDVQERSIASLKLLLDAGADINAGGGRQRSTALHGAAFWGWNDVVRFLAANGADLNAKDGRGNSPADAAMGRAGGNSRGGQRIDQFPDTARLLVDLGAEMPERGIEVAGQ